MELSHIYTMMHCMCVGVHWPKYVCLSSFVYQYSRHLFLIHWVGPLAKVGLSAKFCALVFKASLVYDLEGVDLLADVPIAIIDHRMSVQGGRSAR